MVRRQHIDVQAQEVALARLGRALSELVNVVLAVDQTQECVDDQPTAETRAR